MAGLIRKKTGTEAWETVEDTGGGGSMPAGWTQDEDGTVHTNGNALVCESKPGHDGLFVKDNSGFTVLQAGDDTFGVSVSNVDVHQKIDMDGGPIRNLAAPGQPLDPPTVASLSALPLFADLETSDPGIVGQLWNDADVVKVSHGGGIDTGAVFSPGSGFAIADTGYVHQNNDDGTYIVDTVAPFSGAIVAVDQGAQTFEVAGDHQNELPIGETFVVAGSTGNDGFYTISAFEIPAGNSVVTVVEVIPDATADGTITTTHEGVATFTITAPGTGYSISSDVPCNPSGGQPGVGVGFAIDITSVVP